MTYLNLSDERAGWWLHQGYCDCLNVHYMYEAAEEEVRFSKTRSWHRWLRTPFFKCILLSNLARLSSPSKAPSCSNWMFALILLISHSLLTSRICILGGKNSTGSFALHQHPRRPLQRRRTPRKEWNKTSWLFTPDYWWQVCFACIGPYLRIMVLFHAFRLCQENAGAIIAEVPSPMRRGCWLSHGPQSSCESI
jgi:hypothetical protein